MKRGLLLPAVVVLLISSCTLFEISRSTKRNSVPLSIKLTNDVTLTSIGAVHIYVIGLVDSDFFPAGFMIEYPGKVIYIDPVAVDNPKPADYIFLTHAHGDHLSLDDLKKLSGQNTLIVCPKTVADKLSGYNIKEIKPGEVLELGGIKCEAVAAYNLKPGAFGLTAHPKSEMNVGYILTINGVRIYHAGDTDFIPEMKSITDITVAMVPIGGGNLTMDPERAAAAINTIRPSIAVPIHYTLGTNSAEIFKKFVDKNVQIKIME